MQSHHYYNQSRSNSQNPYSDSHSGNREPTQREIQRWKMHSDVNIWEPSSPSPSPEKIRRESAPEIDKHITERHSNERKRNRSRSRSRSRHRHRHRHHRHHSSRSSDDEEECGPSVALYQSILEQKRLHEQRIAEEEAKLAALPALLRAETGYSDNQMDAMMPDGYVMRNRKDAYMEAAARTQELKKIARQKRLVEELKAQRDTQPLEERIIRDTAPSSRKWTS